MIVQVFLAGGIDSVSVPRADRGRHVPAPAAEARAPARHGHAVRRGRAPALAPVGGGARRAARRGQGLRDAGGRLRAPGPVALRLAPLLRGRRARPAASARAGSAATSTASARPTTRSRASRSTPRSRRRSPPARVPVAAVDAPTDYNFWARDVWGDVDALMLDASARIGAVHARGEPALAQVAGAAMHTGALRSQLAPLRAGEDGAPAFASPVAYPASEESDFPERLAALAQMLAIGPAAALRRDHRAGRLRHARQPGRDARRAAQAHLRRARRVPARPRGARARRPRARPRVVGVRPPRGRERRGHRPRRGRARAADRHARRGPHDRRVPGPRRARRARQPARDLRLPRRLRGAARAVARAPTRRASSPTPAAVARPQLVK